MAEPMKNGPAGGNRGAKKTIRILPEQIVDVIVRAVRVGAVREPPLQHRGNNDIQSGN